MQNFNLELFSRLFFLNLSSTLKLNDDFSIVLGQQPSPSSSNQSGLEPPTPPRTPIAPINNSQRNYNNNNDEAKENFEGRPSSHNTNTLMKMTAFQKSFKNTNESDFEDSNFPEESTNFADDDRGGHQNAMSVSMQMSGDQFESDHEESDCASSFEGSKLTLKNVENLLDKSSAVIFFKFLHSINNQKFIKYFYQNFYNPMMQLANSMQGEQGEKQLIGE